MATNKITLGPMYIPNPTIGRPISGAQLFIGEPDLVSQDNQKQVSIQQEDGSIVNIAQPLQTGAGGVILFQGSPVIALVDGQYSMQVLDSSDAQIYYVPKAQDLGPLLSDDSVGNGSDRVAWTVRNPAQTVTEGLNDHETRIGDNETAIAANTALNLRGNVLIGGDFSRNPWQRGDTFTGVADNEFTADRWEVNLVGGTPAITVTRETLTNPIEGLGFSITNTLKMERTDAAAGTASFIQKIEDVAALAGKDVSLKLVIRASKALQLLPSLDQNHGSGGSGVNPNDMPQVSVTTDWQDLTSTDTLASITANTVGTDSFLQLELAPQTFTGSGDWIEIGFVYLHEDSEDRTLERRQYGEELALCQRYYNVIVTEDDGALFGIASGGAILTTDGRFPLEFPEMRGSPSMEQSGSFSTLGAIGSNPVAITAMTIRTNRLTIWAVGGAVYTVGEALTLQTIAAGVGRIAVDAEI